MESTNTHEILSAKQYLELENSVQERYELLDGIPRLKPSGTINHARTLTNLLMCFGRGSAPNSEIKFECFMIGLRVEIQPEKTYVYPDFMIFGSDVKESETEVEAVVSPILVVEVLSKQSADYDRGEKFHQYRKINSLKEYVLVSQEKPVVEIFERVNDLWRIVKIEGLEEKAHFNSVGVEVEMTEIYKDVVFPPGQQHLI